jgi:hypothetical protein
MDITRLISRRRERADRSAAPKRKSALVLEPLESRLVLSTFTFDPTGGTTTIGGYHPGPQTGTISFNWGSGDALAVGGVTAVNNFISNGNKPGPLPTTFQLYAQLKLSNLNNAGGGTTPTGLNSTATINPPAGYQITEVVSFTEQVSAVSGNAATFEIASTQKAPSGLTIYYQDIQAAGGLSTDFNAGTGFTAAATGTIIYQATIFTNENSNFTDTTKQNGLPTKPLNPTGTNYVGTMTDQGVGGVSLDMTTTFVDTNFFKPDAGMAFTASNFTSNLNNPFAQIPASIKFNDPLAGLGAGATGPVPNIGSVNGFSGPDFLFQISGAAQSFTQTPTSTPPAGKGDTATIGFWHNKNNGQKIIDGLGTSDGSGLGDKAGGGLTVAAWLVKNFPTLSGLWGVSKTDSNAAVAAEYLNIFDNGGSPKVLAQIFDTALTIFATSTDLNHTGGNTSLVASAGFNISAGGTGSHTITIADPQASALGLAPGTYTIFAIVKAADSVAPGGLNSTVNDLFDNDINSKFDI